MCTEYVCIMCVWTYNISSQDITMKVMKITWQEVLISAIALLYIEAERQTYYKI